MRTLRIVASLMALSSLSDNVRAEPNAKGVVKVELPRGDATLLFIEAGDGMRVGLKTASASVRGRTLYLGDGKVAVELRADDRGIWFQDNIKLWQGYQFRNGSRVTLKPGYKKAADLKSGDVYVILPGVTFTKPDTK